MAGITVGGFVVKTTNEAKTEYEALFKTAFGASIDLAPQSNFGQIIGILSEREGDFWAALQAVYDAFTTDGAQGASLDNLAGLTGTIRKPATTSTVSVIATGTNGTVLAAGRQISVEDTGVKFNTLAGATLATATAWAATTSYAEGDIRRNGGTAHIYRCIDGGVSAGSGGPSGTGSAITDGTVLWEHVGLGAAFATIACESDELGPKVALAGTLNVISTPVSGWNAAFNPLDAEVGQNLETDGALRFRREIELRGHGKATVDAIRAAVLALDGVLSCGVFENVTDHTDADGLPPHSIETLVRGGVDAEIAETIFGAIAAGINTFGTSSETVTDSQSFTHTINFSRPETLNIYVTQNIVIDEKLFPAETGEDLIKEAIVDYGDAQANGKNVVANALGAQTFSVPGVLECETLIGLLVGPTLSTTIQVSLRQLAVFDSSRIVLNITPGTP